MPLAVGSSLGPYEILAPIGAGGMGEVYKARDPRVGRDVAVKVCAENFSDRFEIEARAIAALNHPNICHLYDVGANYLVMELIEGERIKGPLPPDTALKHAEQIADALAAAHEKNIVHRDLKPANILVTPAGQIKILDFGLAKAADPPAGAATSENSPTITVSPTRAGIILGTAAYMSPEQARGKSVDRRSDVFSFGVVLYEMITGAHAFQGETITDIIAAVVKEQPDLSRIPAKLRRVLVKCLEKDPRQRLQAIGDWKLLLDADTKPTGAGLPWIPWAAFAAATLALAALAFLHFRETPPEAPVIRTQILPPDKTAFNFSGGLLTIGPVALSPDGLKMVFSAKTAEGKNQLWIRRLDASAAQPLAGTDDASHPFWSPDSRFIGFFAGGQLRKIDSLGGPPVTLCPAPSGRGATWNEDGIIVFGNQGGVNSSAPVSKVSASGGVPAEIQLDAPGRWPWFLPGGRHFVYSAGATVRLASLDSKETKVLVETLSDAEYSQGRLIYLRDDTLVAQPFDLKKLALTGEPIPIAEHVLSVGNLRRGIFSVSQNELLAFQSGSAQGTRLAWVDRSGKVLEVLPPEVNNPLGVELSPDQKTLAVPRFDPLQRGYDVWLYSFARNSLTRFTFTSENRGSSVIWSPDGTTIVFSSQRRGKHGLYRKAANLSGTEEQLYVDEFPNRVTSWSPDGKWILFHRNGTGGIFALPLEGDRKPVLLVNSASAYFGRFSPDGRWLAYQSDESGHSAVSVIPFPGLGGQVQISTAGGIQPRWRKDGNEIFFHSPIGFMAADVNVKNGAIEVGRPRLDVRLADGSNNCLRLRRLFGRSEVSCHFRSRIVADGAADARSELDFGVKKMSRIA